MASWSSDDAQPSSREGLRKSAQPLTFTLGVIMNPKHYLSVDERLLGVCAYCGGAPNTRDHVPSRFFMDDPLPDNLPVVDACVTCNQGFSLDEEYVACFLECVLVGSTDVEHIRRDKVKQALSRNPQLVERIRSSAHVNGNGSLTWLPESDRVRNIVLKLARGHIAYELSLTQLDAPDEIHFFPLAVVSEDDRNAFENAGTNQFRPWPEVGSRAFLRACDAEPYDNQQGQWVIVQPGRYRYSVDQYGGVRVQMVLSEYLACIVDWV